MLKIQRILHAASLLLRRSARRARSSILGTLVNPRAFQPATPYPHGHTKQTILNSLVAISVDGSASGELVGYATADCERFLHTLGLVPEGATGELLEIGANPYFTTLLLRRFRPELRLSLVNYFGPGAVDGSQEVVFPGFDGSEESVEFEFRSANIEQSVLPYPDNAFDFVLFCEVLEHMTNDPMRALLELKRVLKPNGCMVLTTPNAARLENTIAFIEGRNMYDPYSAYGPYGRHNREYTRHELHELMSHCGFDNEISFTGNVHDDISAQMIGAQAINDALAQVRNREHDLGQYLFTRWKNTRDASGKLPGWLYRSYPPDRMM